jgi:hypothetical protein
MGLSQLFVVNQYNELRGVLTRELLLMHDASHGKKHDDAVHGVPHEKKGDAAASKNLLAGRNLCKPFKDCVLGKEEVDEHAPHPEDQIRLEIHPGDEKKAHL